MSQEDLDWWALFWTATSAIGGLLAAAATVWAVIVSLKTSRDQTSPKVQIEYDEFLLSSTGETVVVLNATNVGLLPATLTHVKFTLGWPWQIPITMALLKPTQDQLSQSLPVKLEHGDRFQYKCANERFDVEIGRTVLSNLKSSLFPKLFLRTLKVGVHMTVNKESLVPVSKTIIRRLRTSFLQQKKLTKQ